MASVLFVTEDPALRQLAEVILTRAGHELMTVRRVEDCLRATLSVKMDAVVFDCATIGRLDELTSLCDALKLSNPQAGVLIITSIGGPLPFPTGMVHGLLKKPVVAAELDAAVGSALFESQPALAPVPIDANGSELDPRRLELRRNGRAVKLSVKEFELARYFAERPARIVTFRDVLEDLWCLPLDDSSLSTLRSHMHNLRRKFQSVGAGGLLRTMKGRGYQLLAPAPAPDNDAPAG